MKKFTLLAVVAMLAVTAFAQTEINGIKLSEGKDTANFHFYRIRNMRAMRLDFTNGTIRNLQGDSVNCDRMGYYLSETLPDGVTPTPKISDHPYMGLSNMDGNWWLSFANDEEIKDPRTEYWYFTGNSRFPGQLKIQNAVITGSVSTSSKRVTDLDGFYRSNMDFNTRNNFYYVLPVKPAFEAMNTEDECWTDSILQYLTEEDFDRAFAFSLKDTISNDYDYRNQCLDMNNYINVMNRVPKIDENGDTIRNADGNTVYNRYGFVGVDRTWSPVTAMSYNKNHWENNGSIFFVEPVPTAEVLAAIESYKEVIAEVYREDAVELAKSIFAKTANTIKGWRNLYAIFNESAIEQLKNIQHWCENWNGEGADLKVVHDTNTRDAYIAEVEKIANKKLIEATALVGKGCKVRFQNQLALRDLDMYVNEGENIDLALQLGNAYIAAGGDPTYRQSHIVSYISDDDAFKDYMGKGIEPRLEADEECEWELIPVPNTVTFLLYNEATNSYIRKYHDMYDYYGGEDMFMAASSAIDEYSWATTEDVNDAAPFTLIACPDAAGQTALTEEQEDLLFAAGLDTEIENKVRLQACYSETVENPATHESVVTDYVFNIHRGSHGSDYRFINWTPIVNNWFSDTNAFKIESVEMGELDKLEVSNVDGPISGGNTLYVGYDYKDQSYNWETELTVKANVPATYTVTVTSSAPGVVLFSGVTDQSQRPDPTASASAYFEAGETFNFGLSILNCVERLENDVDVDVTVTNGYDSLKFHVCFTNTNNSGSEDEEPWTSIGVGEWYEGLLTIFDVFDDGMHWPVEIEESTQTPGIYRMKPYAVEGNPIAEVFEEVDDNTTVIVNATDPMKVYIDGPIMPYELYYFLGINPENGFSGEGYGTLSDKIITFPSKSFAYSKDGTSWGYVNSDCFMITLPGAVVKDYSITPYFADQEISENNKWTINVETGEDVASVRYIIFDFDAKPSDYTEYFAEYGALLEGSSLEVDPANVNYPNRTMTKSGLASVIFAAMDADNNVMKTGHIALPVIIDDEQEGWSNVGNTEFIDGIFAQYYSNYSYTNSSVLVQAKSDNSPVYRFVNPYAVEPRFYMAGHTHSMVVDATHPDWVAIPLTFSGLDLAGEGVLAFGSCAALGYDYESALEYNVEGGTMEENVVTFPINTIFVHEQFYNEPRSWYYGNFKEPVTITLPVITIDVTVTNSNGTGVEGASVSLADSSESEIETYADETEIFTDAEGKATIEVPFAAGYFGKVNLYVNGRKNEITLNGAENKAHVILETSQIEEITGAEDSEKVIYDVQGRRVAKAGHGLYIINGKKALVK